MNNLAITNNDHTFATDLVATPMNLVKEKKTVPFAPINLTELFADPAETSISVREPDKKNKLEDFLSNKLIKITTISSAIVNVLSAPVRMFDNANPLKKIINQISMLFTKGHLLSYATAGLISAFRQKNPFLVFSFAVEGVAAFLKLRGIYLFRGLATGIDGAITAIKDRFKKVEYSSFAEGLSHNMQAISKMTKEVAANPKRIFEGAHLAMFASLTAAFGSVVGMTVSEQLGGFVRDAFGGLGDLGIFKFNHSLARQSGFLYLGGSILDLCARVFNKALAKVLGVRDAAAFEKLRDVFHELAIAFDRGGQYFFLKYNQETDLSVPQSS